MFGAGPAERTILMFLDILIYLTTPCTHYIRRMGYVTESIAMRKRSRRRRAAWQPHLENTRRFVLNSANECRNRGMVIVLGSGLLLDVPLEELSSLFRDVVLLDVVCLPEIRRRIRNFKNVKFVEHDVSSIAERLYENKLRGIHELPDVKHAGADYHKADFVVSLNILSQLTVIPREFAIKHLPGLTEDRIAEWCREIVEAHYASLQGLRSSVCLIADHEFVKRDRQGTIFSRGSTIGEFTLPDPDATWVWKIQPGKQDSAAKELIVGAWNFRK